MVNEEIFGGLRSALERGESLKRAMMTFYNSGYKKEEIEEAAKALSQFKPESQLIPPVKTAKTSEAKKVQPKVAEKPKPMPEKKTIQPKVQKPAQQPAEVSKPVQKVSSYGEEQPKEKSKEKTIIYILIALLGFLILLLLIIFLFRNQLIDFFSGLLSG